MSRDDRATLSSMSKRFRELVAGHGLSPRRAARQILVNQFYVRYLSVRHRGCLFQSDQCLTREDDEMAEAAREIA
jgi:hypothetical protein